MPPKRLCSEQRSRLIFICRARPLLLELRECLWQLLYAVRWLRERKDRQLFSMPTLWEEVRMNGLFLTAS